MENIRIYEKVTVKDWIQKEDKIYLLTEEGVELLYVGRYGVKELLVKAQKGRIIYVGIDPAVTCCAILDDVVHFQLR